MSTKDEHELRLAERRHPMTKREEALSASGRLLYDEHTNMRLTGHRCGQVWGEMAPPGDKPGTMHWCSRNMVTIPDPDNPDDGPPAVTHPGKHRCTCGEYAPFSDSTVMVCRFPAGPDPAGRECGKTIDGLTRETHELPGSIIRGTPPRRFQIVRSSPCGHAVRRGF